MLKSSSWFGLVYTLSLISAIVGIPIQVAGLPLKFVFIAVLLAMCLIYRPQRVDWFVVSYVAFLFFFFLAGVASGYVSGTLMKLLGTYLVSIVLYRATTIMVDRFNNLNWVSLVLVVLFIIDAAVTLGQYYQNPLCMSLPQLLQVEMKETVEAAFYDSASMEGVHLVGIVGAVANGYVLSAATILAWLSFGKGKMLFVNLFIWGLCILASFYTQERAGFYLAILFSVYIIFLKFHTDKGFGRLLIFLLIVLFVVFAGQLFEKVSSSGRYIMGFEGQDRIEFIENGLAFISRHPFGSVDLYMQQASHMPHNLFINMFVAGGWFGGTILLGIVIYQMYLCGMFILKAKKKVYWHPFLYVLMYLNITAQSIVHNSSLVYGGALFFVFWGVVSCYANKGRLELLYQKGNVGF